jgi:hypothetical protein
MHKKAVFIFIQGIIDARVSPRNVIGFVNLAFHAVQRKMSSAPV